MAVFIQLTRAISFVPPRMSRPAPIRLTINVDHIVRFCRTTVPEHRGTVIVLVGPQEILVLEDEETVCRALEAAGARILSTAEPREVS